MPSDPQTTEDKIKQLKAVLLQCQKQFAFYAEEHRKKGNEQKAQTNQDYVEMCQQVRAGEP